jgi:hypothetical protein
MLNDDEFVIGFMLAGFIWTIWWNLDWRRYLKFYYINGPAYPVWIQLLFRTFFALCSLGTAVELGRRLLQSAHQVQFYLHCLLVAGAWFAAIVLMVLAAESMMARRGKRVIPPQ